MSKTGTTATDVQKAIDDWREAHPDGTRSQCIRDGVASKSSVYRLWLKADQKGATETKDVPTEKKEEERSDRLTVVMSPIVKRRLRHLCVDMDISAAEWIERAVNRAWSEQDRGNG